jgi:RimJ/RimL family protein N-acetyltransferase
VVPGLWRASGGLVGGPALGLKLSDSFLLRADEVIELAHDFCIWHKAYMAEMRATKNEVLGVDIPFHLIEGRLVELEPLMAEHKEEVRAAIDCDPAAWSILLVNPMGAGFEEYWSANCGAPPTERLPYAIRQLSDGQVVGVSTYFTAKAKHGGVEIGATFLRPDVRASFVNPETKLLMLGHAFNSGAVRVQFTVDVRNERSQAAVAKLGAVREGVLRRDTRTWTGHIRDTVVFSILDSEWPTVKLRLEQRLAKLTG